MIKAIAIDLDDTLLDTSGLLAPKATVDAFNFLIQNGLQLSLNECEARRIDLIKTISHRDVFEKLAQEHGDDNTRRVVQQTIDLFYNPVLPPTLPLLEGARENLDYLKGKYPLYLVTAGAEKSQISKVRALGIEDYFQKIFIVNSLEKKRKVDAFLEIMRTNKTPAHEFLCIGNSISSEIKDALSLGAVACYFEFGESRGAISDLPRKPHFHIHHHAQLIPTCQL